MTYVIIFLLIFYLSNSFIDAIDHQKGSRTLKFWWHFFKWIICLSSLFLAGVSLTCILINVNPFYVFGMFFLLYYLTFLPILIGFHCFWELHYRFWRWIFTKYGIPDYFVRKKL